MKRIILFISLFLCLVLFESASIAQQETLAEIDEAFDLAVNNFFSVSPCALKPQWSEVYKSGSFAATPTEAYITNDAGVPADLYAPVYLPDGVTIKLIAALLKDNDGASASNYVMVQLVRRNHGADTIEVVAQVSTDGLSPSINKRLRKTSSISYPTVDNRHTYYIRVYFGPDGGGELLFHGFWIIYE